MENEGFKSAISRVFEAAGCRTQIELAEFLGIRQSSISDAKRRNTIPSEWLVKLLRLKGVSPEWILTGHGPRLLGPATGEIAPHVMYLTEIRPPKECSAQDLINELVHRAWGKFDAPRQWLSLRANQAVFLNHQRCLRHAYESCMRRSIVPTDTASSCSVSVSVDTPSGAGSN